MVSARDKRIEAAQAADIVFEAIRENRFWIFTDPRWTQSMRARVEGMLARRNPGPTLV